MFREFENFMVITCNSSSCISPTASQCHTVTACAYNDYTAVKDDLGILILVHTTPMSLAAHPSPMHTAVNRERRKSLRNEQLRVGLTAGIVSTERYSKSNHRNSYFYACYAYLALA